MRTNVTNIFSILISTLLFITTSITCHAGMKEALASMQTGDFDKAVSEIQLIATNGDAEAQYYLGAMYNDGKGVKKNYTDAAYWFTKSAEQGYSIAQYNLAMYYLHGLGVEKNAEKTIYWHKKSAENGFAYAQSKLAEKYTTGDGIEKNYENAFFWFKKAAEQGEPSAQYSLGQFLYHGVLKQDYTQAFNWYKKSADQDFTDAQYALGNMYFDGKGSEQNFEKAYFYWLIASQKGHPDAKKNADVVYQKLPLTVSMRVQLEVSKLKSK